MRKIDFSFGKTKPERIANGLSLVVGVCALTVLLHQKLHGGRIGDIDNTFMLFMSLLNLVPTGIMLIVQWRDAKVKETARLDKEKQDVARAEAVLAGPMHDWK